MLTTLFVAFTAALPFLGVVALLELADWWRGRHRAAVARQIALTDAIARELGAIVAPTVRWPLRGPWRIEMAVPFGRPATVASILAIAHRVAAFGERMCAGRYEIVLTAQEEPRAGGGPGSAGAGAGAGLAQPRRVGGPLSDEILWLREAMRGPEAAAVRAEFHRRGIAPPERRGSPVGFGV